MSDIMDNLKNSVEQQPSSSVSTDPQNNASTSTEQNMEHQDDGCGHKSRERLRANKRNHDHDLDLQSEMAVGSPTPTKNICRSPPSPRLMSSRSRSRAESLRNQVLVSNSNLAAIMKPPDANKQQQRVNVNLSNTIGGSKPSNTDQQVGGQTGRVSVQHQTKQSTATGVQLTVNHPDTVTQNATTINLTRDSATMQHQSTTFKNGTANSTTELRTIIDGLSKSLSTDKQQCGFDITLPHVNDWIAALHGKLTDELKWPDVSGMEVVGNSNAFVDLPIKLLAEKLNWLLRSREEALQNVMKWQTTPPKIAVLPNWMVFPKFTQRTDFSKSIHQYSAQFEQAYVKQITVHFIECFRNIQQEIDVIVHERPECMALLTSEQQSELRNKQSKSNARFSQMTASTKYATATSSRQAMSASNINPTSSVGAAAANNITATSFINATSVNNMLGPSSKNGVSVNDNAAMDTTGAEAQPDHAANKSAAQWPGESRGQQRRRGSSNRRYNRNRYASSQHYAAQTARPIYNRQLWNSNYYSNNPQPQPYGRPWTYYNQRRPQNGPFRRPNYYNSHNRRGGHVRYNSYGQSYNNQPPWHNYHGQRPLTRGHSYAAGGTYDTEYRGTAARWQPYGNYQSYGGYAY
jgi:hypothetical protein